ncbi:MAG TPA: AMP-binding protein [Thermoleophilaceae bacterium]|nr:AMP-binding protein [Thermoleophilaceae bacterium]
MSVGGREREAYRHEDPAPMPARDLQYHDLLTAAVEAAPERQALVFLPGDPGREVRMTYRELDAAVARTARALLASGVEHGGVVAVYAANRPEFVLVQFACSRIGAATVPVNPLYETDELAYVLERSGAEICFADHRHRDADLWARLSAVAPKLPRLRLLVALSEETPGAVRWDEWLGGGDELEDGRVDELEGSLDPRATVQIQFTSGTTGRPKAVQLSGYGLANGGHCVAQRAGLEDGCRYLHAMPFFHVGGTVTAMATLMAVAGTHLFLPYFSPSAMCAAIESERPTAILAVPTMLIALADRADAQHLSLESVETVLTGGALVPEAVAARWIDGRGVGISNTYGLTEVSGPAVCTSPDDPRDRALQTIGRPLPGIEVDVVAIGTSERVELEAEGELRFRGWGTMNGYLGDERATSAVIDADGWFRSGDLGRLSADGFVQVTGRAKDVIIRGGENIAPSTVEDAIRAHVDDVVDVSVVGVPDDYYGEAVAAFVTLREGASLTRDELAALLDGRLASFRIPAHLRVVDALPTTASGKVQKYRLVEMFGQERA